jgi:hypothetical protein
MVLSFVLTRIGCGGIFPTVKVHRLIGGTDGGATLTSPKHRGNDGRQHIFQIVELHGAWSDFFAGRLESKLFIEISMNAQCIVSR